MLSCDTHRPVMIGSGVEVSIPVDGHMNVDFAAWHAACLVNGAPRSALTIATYVGKDGTTCKVFVCFLELLDAIVDLLLLFVCVFGCLCSLDSETT